MDNKTMIAIKCHADKVEVKKEKIYTVVRSGICLWWDWLINYNGLKLNSLIIDDIYGCVSFRSDVSNWISVKNQIINCLLKNKNASKETDLIFLVYLS